MKNQLLTAIQRVALLGFFGLLFSCDPGETILKPIIETTAVSKLTESTVETGGLISSDEGNVVTKRGVCWSASPNPTISDNITNDAAGTGAYVSKIDGLSPNTTYYLRAYATNKGGTAYGLQVTFTTKTLTLTSIPAYFIMATTAITGGMVASDGDSIKITARGVCWNTFPNPTIDDSVTVNGIGKGTYNSFLTGLQPQTTYFVRAYVTNSVGTYYGNEITFTTQDGIATMTTSNATSIKTGAATINGNVTDDGGDLITNRGICWGTNSSPTINDKTINCGLSTGSFTGYLNGLIANTTYYARVFATNGVGTFYGNEITFRTMDGIVNLTTTNASSITSTSLITGGTVVSDGGATITDMGVCLSTSQNPTVSDTKKSCGSGSNLFSTSMSGLTPLTTYYIRAYATNNIGTSYGNQITVTTNASDPSKVTDIDGNDYATVKIGNQLWMASNLKTTKYRNGDLIANVTNTTVWQTLSTGAWCDYDNSASNGSIYGHLYNAYAVSDSRNIAPSGWHIPTDAEWDELITFLGGASIAGGKMKEAGYDHWNSPNSGATNESGFNALPAGFSNSQGWNLYSYCYFWSSTIYSTTQTWNRALHNSETGVERTYNSKNFGFSIRCVKD
jgi:uncharacterized protein (TIGR02145 family)